MLSKVYTGALYGLEARPVSVETDLSQGLPSLAMVGLPDVTIREAKERIRTAIINSGFRFPAKRITINLSPANTKKEGSHFDLPIAVGVLASIEAIEKDSISEYAFMGELSLTGEINRIDGALPLVMGLKTYGINKIVIPADNLAEAKLVKEVELYPVSDLCQLVEHFNGITTIKPESLNEEISYSKTKYGIDYAEVAGQENVKRAVTIACAGWHGMMMMGIPGTGKSMIAKRIPTVLPEMSYEESLEVTKIYSIGGELSKERPRITERPFRTPHHTISGVALVGGGNRPKPGELSLSHLGVLFLDEFSEFSRSSLEMLRQPLEERVINISRVAGSFSFPCDVMLVAASNPCPCGYFGSKTHECNCSQTQINNYRGKLSGPLMDRIDLHVEVMPLEYEDLDKNYNDYNDYDKKRLSSSDMRKAVNIAREIQIERYRGEPVLFNSQMTPSLIKQHCKLDEESKKLLKDAFKTMALSGRSYNKILKISRTIADLEGSNKIKIMHIAEALSYRMNYKRI